MLSFSLKYDTQCRSKINSPFQVYLTRSYAHIPTRIIKPSPSQKRHKNKCRSITDSKVGRSRRSSLLSHQRSTSTLCSRVSLSSNPRPLSLSANLGFQIGNPKLDRSAKERERDGSVAEDSRSLQRNRREDHRPSHRLRLQRERRSQRQRVHHRRRQSRLQMPYLVLVIFSEQSLFFSPFLLILSDLFNLYASVFTFNLHFFR